MENHKVILVIDDAEGEVAVKTCIRSFCDVYTLATPEGLYEQLRISLPDLILISEDIKLTDCKSMLEKIKIDAPHAEKIPVIILSKPYSEMDINEVKKKLQTRVKPCVLAVDDAPDILKAIYHELHNDYRVITLPKPEMLKKILAGATPDLFLLDYHMPGLNGFELIPIIREMAVFKDTPIIFLTSSRTLSRVKEALILGACDYITKPFDPDILREKIAKHLG